MAEVVGKPESPSARARDVARRLFRHENAALLVVLIALIAGMGAVTKGATLGRANMMNVLLQSAVTGVAAIGQAFVILTGGIDLSVGGMGLMSGILGATMMTEAPHLNIVGHPVSVYTAIPIMLVVATGWGAINGSAVSRLGMPALIVTLAMWEITKGVAFQVSGGYSITQMPEALVWFGSGTIAGVPVPVIAFIAVAVIAYFILSHTPFGRSVYAVGGNPVSAWLSGINVKRIIFSVYVIAGFLAGMAGVIMTARVMSASMRTLQGLELNTIAAVCIGGVSLMGGIGSIIGVVIGILIIGVINNGMSVLGAGPAVQGIVKGVIIFTAVAIDYVRHRG
jgi:ribose/xylose/arabinose/galactoside ABC-type transport system permease subunit